MQVFCIFPGHICHVFFSLVIVLSLCTCLHVARLQMLLLFCDLRLQMLVLLCDNVDLGKHTFPNLYVTSAPLLSKASKSHHLRRSVDVQDISDSWSNCRSGC
eukprot:c11468_g1_i2 orf=92-397(-)